MRWERPCRRSRRSRLAGPGGRSHLRADGGMDSAVGRTTGCAVHVRARCLRAQRHDRGRSGRAAGRPAGMRRHAVEQRQGAEDLALPELPRGGVEQLRRRRAGSELPAGRHARGHPARARAAQRLPVGNQRLEGVARVRYGAAQRAASLPGRRVGLGARRLPGRARHRGAAPLREGVVATRAHRRLGARPHQRAVPPHRGDRPGPRAGTKAGGAEYDRAKAWIAANT